MGATLVVQQHWADGKRQHVVGVVTIPAGTVYVTGGIPFPVNVDGVFSQSPIVYSDVVGLNGYYQYENTNNVYNFRYVPALPASQSAVLANGLLRIFSGGTEIAAGALPAAVTTSTITFYGIFRKNF